MTEPQDLGSTPLFVIFPLHRLKGHLYLLVDTDADSVFAVRVCNVQPGEIKSPADKGWH